MKNEFYQFPNTKAHINKNLVFKAYVLQISI